MGYHHRIAPLADGLLSYHRKCLAQSERSVREDDNTSTLAALSQVAIGRSGNLEQAAYVEHPSLLAKLKGDKIFRMIWLRVCAFLEKKTLKKGS
jgi:hypothetical protein